MSERRFFSYLNPASWLRRAPKVGVVRLTGAIGMPGPLRNGGLSISSIAGPLERAFGLKNLEAVALVINSPGGSAVQSSLIAKRIRVLAGERNVPVLAFVEDVAASGGYWLATAGDEIYADESSIIGSIGVVAAGFGFTELLQRVGVERRVHTAGPRKAMLDPFLPEKPDEVERLKLVQREIHDDFIALVKERRGARLTGPESDLFSGEYWTGRTAVELGLADAVGELRSILRERFGDKVITPVIAPERSLLGRVRPGVGLEGMGRDGFADELISALEARALWARYGL